MSKEIGMFLGKQVGVVKDIDYGASGDCMGKFLRVLVRIDISKQLKKGLPVSLDDSDKSSVLIIRYEHLSEYYFGCGWLRASSPLKTRPPRFVREEAPTKVIHLPEPSTTSKGKLPVTDPIEPSTNTTSPHDYDRQQLAPSQNPIIEGPVNINEREANSKISGILIENHHNLNATDSSLPTANAMILESVLTEEATDLH
ncbi:hypothetical protein ACOSQ4_010155 [Xanthoceras sorbifolium]